MGKYTKFGNSRLSYYILPWIVCCNVRTCQGLPANFFVFIGRDIRGRPETLESERMSINALSFLPPAFFHISPQPKQKPLFRVELCYKPFLNGLTPQKTFPLIPHLQLKVACETADCYKSMRHNSSKNCYYSICSLDFTMYAPLLLFYYF